MAAPYVSIASCLIIWSVAWGVFAQFLWLRGITYIRRWGWTTLYFLAVGVSTISIFRPTLQSLLVPGAAVPIGILLAFMLAQWILYAHLSARLRPIPQYLKKFPLRDYVLLLPRRLISKSADIFAQQVFIVLITLSLKGAGLGLPAIILGFFIAFSLVHIPPIAYEWGNWPAWNFFGAVVLFSVLFPPIILLVPYGFVYTFIIHWAFYTLTALLFWSRIDSARWG